MAVSKTGGVLGIILARGGSKSILKKNIALCAGKPLLFYTAEAIRNARLLDRTVICTDDPEIADYAKSQGIEVPFVEPAELAQDHSPDLPVMQFVLNWFRENEDWQPEMVVHLRPTTPLKSSADIDAAIELMRAHPEAESVRSVCEPIHTPFKTYRLEEGDPFLKPLLKKEYPELFEQYPEPYNLPRQLLPKIWRHSGYVDVIRPEVIVEKNSMSGSRMLPFKFEKWRDVDIDCLDDLLRAEIIIRRLKDEGKETWH